MKIGIFGGTFNPPHNSHLDIAVAFSRKIHFDKLFFIPTKAPVHKRANHLVSGQHRLAMTKLLVKDIKGFSALNIEIKSLRKSYTYLTLRKLKRKYVDAEFYLIIGSDMLLYFDKWKNYEEIISSCKICCYYRLSDNLQEVDAKREYLQQNYGCEIDFVQEKSTDISSKAIREKLKSFEDASEFTTPDIIDYINKERLYING